MLWDVTYERRANAEHAHTLQVEADSLTLARSEALPLVGTRATITRIDRAYPDLPVTDPDKRRVQGT